MSVKTTAFLHGELFEREDLIYISQRVSLLLFSCVPVELKKSLYGLKQSPRQWYKRFDTLIYGGTHTV
jgi:hypothetical protein